MKPHETNKIVQPACGMDGVRLDSGEARGAQGIKTADLARLEVAVAGEVGRTGPSAEPWNPPYCGDIGLAIASDGTWSYRGSPIRRLALVKLFASVLRREEDGRHYLVTPIEKVDVAVEDAPFLAVAMEVLGQGRAQTLIMRTNLDDVVRIGRQCPLRFAPSRTGVIKPYVRVRGGIEALVTRALTYDLAELLVEDTAGQMGLWSEGLFFPLAQDGQHPASKDPVASSGSDLTGS